MESAHLHLARAICRRAERAIHRVIEEDAECEIAGKFLNRLSDYLFIAARYACHKTGNVERIYRKAT